MSLKQIGTEITATPLEDWEEREFEKRSEELHRMTDNQLLKEILTKSDKKCNALIERQNTLIEDLTTSVNNLESANDYNVNELKRSVSNAVIAMKNLQDETRRFNDRISTELSQTVKRTETSLQSNLRKTIQTQSEEVFTEVRKDLDESKKLLEFTRVELKLQGRVRKFFFWATPIILLVQTIIVIVSAF